MKKSVVIKTVVGLALVAAMAMSVVACSTTPAASSAASSQAASAAPASSAAAAAAASTAPSANSSDTITVVWYPNESAQAYDASREEFAKLVSQATGKKVVNKTTTDYTIAIQSLADGTAQIGAVFGAVGYIQAQQKNPAVKSLMVNTGASGTLNDAFYWSMIAVAKENADKYKDASGKYSIANIQGKKMSFVSTSSTSGFVIPTTYITSQFKSQDKWKGLNQDAFTQGGTDKFFSEVMLGQTHQGSAVFLLSGKADVAAFCDTELAQFVDIVSGGPATAGANEVLSGEDFKVKANAAAPFDTVAGKEYVVLAANQVMNGPCCYNSKALSAEDAKKIQALFTSDTVTNDPLIFYAKDAATKGFFSKTAKQQILAVDDAWYEPIRKIMQ